MSEQLLFLIVLAVVVIVFANTIASRVRVAGPLILVGIGVVISLIPAVPALAVAPELILVGVLPPLLFSAAVSAPAIEFRRDLSAIGGMSVLLVILSSLVLGFFFAWAVPGLGLPLGIALGAILSPTDAVATSIVRRLGVPRRVLTILEGESLLNDATALVTLRTAIAVTATSFSFVATLGAFVWAVLSAIVIGALVGIVALRLRVWTHSPTANTALGFTVPYLAYLPTEAVGGSGLVAAVAAGVVCGQGALRWLSPDQRISDKLNWRTVEFILEGAVFLIMGLELYGIVQNNLAADEGLLRGALIAGAAFVILVLVRAAYVLPMLGLHNARVRGWVQRRIDGGAGNRRGTRSSQRLGRMRADIEYYDASPLTWKDSTVIVWAGMRGVVTLAAAQTLPRDTPERDLLVFVAFLVAAGSLLIQGLSLPLVTKLLRLPAGGAGGTSRDEVRMIGDDLRVTAEQAVARRAVLRADRTPFADELYRVPTSHFFSAPDEGEGDDTPASLEFELAVVMLMRERLHVLARSGEFSTGAARHMLDELDAYEISLRLHLDGED